MRFVLAVDSPWLSALQDSLAGEDVEVVAVSDSASPAAAVAASGHGTEDGRVLRALMDADVLVLHVDDQSLTTGLVGFCDRRGVRILPLFAEEQHRWIPAEFGLEAPSPIDTPGWSLVELVRSSPAPAPAQHRSNEPHRVVSVWGAVGSPGRSTIATELSVELARNQHRCLLIDADTHAPSLAMTTGLSDDGPGFAAICRLTASGQAGADEIVRISQPLGRTGVRVLTGINRPSRWPELGEARVRDALGVCRQWADYSVVDVAAELERDEEIVSDLDGLRRNSATLATLACSDLIVAVVSGEPVGVARFLRSYSELRALVGATPVAVLVNRVRPAAIGIDARGQLRRALDRFAGITNVWFAPDDSRSVDAALLAARPVAEVAPRSSLSTAIRRFVVEAVKQPVAAPTTRREKRRILSGAAT